MKSRIKLNKSQDLFYFRDGKIILGFTKRSLDFSLGEPKRKENFLKVFRELGISPWRIVEVSQEHRGEVLRFSRGKARSRIFKGYDGIFTPDPGVFLGIRTADCLPLFFWDEKHIGILHCGFRSLKEGIIESLSRCLFLGNLYFFIGPGIRKCCYRLSLNFVRYFEDKYYIRRKKNGFFLDLPGVLKEKLLLLGARRDRIYDGGLCTSCKRELFFSYKVENTHQRMLNFIVRDESL